MSETFNSSFHFALLISSLAFIAYLVTQHPLLLLMSILWLIFAILQLVLYIHYEPKRMRMKWRLEGARNNMEELKHKQIVFLLTEILGALTPTKKKLTRKKKK